MFSGKVSLGKNFRKIRWCSNRLFRWQFARPSLSEGDSQCRRVQGWGRSLKFRPLIFVTSFYLKFYDKYRKIVILKQHLQKLTHFLSKWLWECCFSSLLHPKWLIRQIKFKKKLEMNMTICSTEKCLRLARATWCCVFRRFSPWPLRFPIFPHHYSTNWTSSWRNHCSRPLFKISKRSGTFKVF